MANSLICFYRGIRSATALWPVVLLLYLVDTAMGLILAAPPAARLFDVLGHSALAPTLSGPLTADLLVEMSGGGDAASLPWPLYLLVPLLSLLVGLFLRGGTLGSLAGEGETFKWAGFFGHCACHFRRMLLLSLFFIPGLLLVMILFAIGSLLLGLAPLHQLGPWGLAPSPALLALLIYLLVMALDFARVSLVLQPERSLWRHAGRGFWLVLRRFPQVMLVGLGFALVAFALAAAYPALLAFTPISEAVLLVLLVQQLTILALSWQRVAMLGGEMSLFRRYQVEARPTVRREDVVAPGGADR